MSWFKGLFTSKPSDDDRMAEQRRIIEACEFVLGRRKPHPMARFFAGIRLKAARERLDELEAGQRYRDEMRGLAESTRLRGIDSSGSPFDPITKKPRDSKPKKLGPMPPMIPRADCWRPPAL